MSVSTYTPDSTKILHTAYADFVSRQIGRTAHVVQYDDSLPLLAVKLFSDGQPYTIPANADISIKLGKSDGKFVYNPALGCDSTRHTAYFEITYQMVVLAETVSPIIEVRIGSSIAASSSIGIIIDRNPIQREDIESTSEWKVIEQAIDYAKEAVSSAASASASRSAAAASEQNAAKSEAVVSDIEERVSNDSETVALILSKIQSLINDIQVGNIDNTSDMDKPVSREQRTAIDEAYANANQFTLSKIAELVNGAPETLDTLREVADAISMHDSVVDALDSAIGKKANQTELDTHTGNSTIHVTATERNDWNNKVSKDGDTMEGPLSVPVLILGRTPSTATGAMWIE